MSKEKKLMQVTEDQRDILFTEMQHVGGGFEQRLFDKLPISYQYVSPGDMPIYKKHPMIDLDEYTEISQDMDTIPKGMSKYTHWDRCREFVQNGIIDKIKKDQEDNHTFLLYLRPRIEAIGLSVFKIRLEGKWVKEKNIKSKQAPEEFEPPFPFE